LAVLGDLKLMKPEYLRGVTMRGYGTSLAVGIGIPIPIPDVEICRYTAVTDDELWAQIVDYSDAYPNSKPGNLGEVNYAQLKSGKILIQDKEVPTGSLSSYSKAFEIANNLKESIEKGESLLTEAVEQIPGSDSGYLFRPFNERPIESISAVYN
jgi:uncharacterized protein (DUF39 family)